MVALTEARLTRKREGKINSRAAAANAVIFLGGIVCLSATGYATRGATAATLVADGVAREGVDNTGGVDGAVRLDVEKGTFQFRNSAAADAITLAEIGDDCWIVDDQTVAKTDGGATRSKAGRIVDVDAQGVWVEFR